MSRAVKGWGASLFIHILLLLIVAAIYALFFMNVGSTQTQATPESRISLSQLVQAPSTPEPVPPTPPKPKPKPEPKPKPKPEPTPTKKKTVAPKPEPLPEPEPEPLPEPEPVVEEPPVVEPVEELIEPIENVEPEQPVTEVIEPVASQETPNVEQPSESAQPSELISQEPIVAESTPAPVGLTPADVSRFGNQKLRPLIDRYKKYPNAALKRGITGVTVVGFSMNRDGTVFDIHVVKSSGNQMLDKAAVKAIQKAAGSFPKLPPNAKAVEQFTTPMEFSISY